MEIFAFTAPTRSFLLFGLFLLIALNREGRKKTDECPWEHASVDVSAVYGALLGTAGAPGQQLPGQSSCPSSLGATAR